MALQYSPKIVQDGLVLCLDPSQNKSYPTTDLPVKGGLVMWMDAADDTTFSYSSGTTVSQWRDKSGFNYHMTPTSAGPTRSSILNSRKVLAFTSTQDIRNLSIDLRGSAYTAFCITRYSGGVPYRALTSTTSSNWLLGHWSGFVNQYYALGWVQYQGYSTDSVWRVYMGDWSGASTDSANMYSNGTALVTNSNQASDGPFTLGINAYTGERSECEAAEIIVFNRILTTTERRLVHTYLGQKWGILNTDRSIIDLGGLDDNGLFGNGTTANMPTYDYYNKGSLRFAGHYALCPANTVNSLNGNALTVETWIKHTSFGSVGTGRSYISNWHSFNTLDQKGFILRTFDTQTYPTFWWCWGGGNNYDAFGPSSYVMNLNQIYHIVATYEKGVAVKIYINGKLEGTGTTSVNNTIAFDTTNGIYLGFSNINSSYMYGNMYVARLYNRALTASEVAQNYEAQKSRFTDTIVHQGLILNIDAANPYSYGGAGTTVYDTSNTALSWTATNTTFNTDPIKYFSFNGSNSSLVSSTSSAYDSQTITMECWCYPNSLSQNGFLFEKGAVNTQYSMFFATDPLFIFRTIGGTINNQDLTFAPSTYLTVSAWNHIVCTYNGSSKIIYVNGTQAVSVSASGTLQTGQTNQYIGKYGAAGDNYPFNGRIAESRVYNIALTAAQVLQNYNATRTKYGR